MRDPIVILGAARSGTSMVAGLFAQHGCWEGKCRDPDQYNRKGYHENRALKEVLISRWGHLKRQVEIGKPQEGFRFNEGDPNMVPHIAETGHNEWEHLSHTTGEWVYLGPYRGDGYFTADEPSTPPHEE